MQRLIRFLAVLAVGSWVSSCGDSTTRCPPGLTLCGDSCVSMQTDPDHCGTCDTVCGGAAVCRRGSCTNVCPVGQALCATGCVEAQNDANNCGGCDMKCAPGQACVAGVCSRTCLSSLTLALPDPWGAMWDGIERPAALYDNAKQTCEGMGGRLPTATEMYRVSAARSGAIGQSYNTNYLWSAVPYNPTAQVTVRLDTGDPTTVGSLATSTYPYRCVCPAPPPSAFSGRACHGPAGDECFPLPGTRYNMDRSDRARLSKGAAMWECNFHHAHLADYPVYAQAIVAGLPNGTDAWLHTADDSHYAYDTLVRWNGVAPSWAADGNTTVSNMSDFRPFRCVGVNYAAGTFPNTVPNEFVGPLTGVKGETVDSAMLPTTDVSWVTAHDMCWNRGGHLPRSTELGELIQQRLPAGSSRWLWTSDQEGYDGTQFLAGLVRWLDTQPGYGHYYSDFTTWSYKTNVYPFRCIYYPLDAQYPGPAATSCSGGCLRRDLPGGASHATLWMDSMDRGAATLGGATGICAALGGRLASERDYTEMIRQGLPNGSGAYLLTSDVGYGSSGINEMIIRWNGVDTAYTDQYGTYMTWSGLANPYPFRCVWTNELR